MLRVRRLQGHLSNTRAAGRINCFLALFGFGQRGGLDKNRDICVSHHFVITCGRRKIIRAPQSQCGIVVTGVLSLRGLATQKRTHAVDELADGFEWFRHNIIGAHAPGLGLVDRLVRPDQKHNRNPAEPFTPFDKPAQFITTDAGHVGVREDHIGGGLLELFQCGLAVAYRGDLHSLIGEGETNHGAVVWRVVGD